MNAITLWTKLSQLERPGLIQNEVSRPNHRIPFPQRRAAAYKGYGVLEARPDELLVSYKAPRSVQTPASAAFTLARFRVARGTPAVEVLT